MLQLTEVVKIRRQVLSKIAKLTFDGELDKDNIVDTRMGFNCRLK